MNAGVEILLQRLKDNPEDFSVDPTMYRHDPKKNIWSPFLGEVLNTEYFTDEEKQAVKSAYDKARRENYTERIMKALAGEDETSDEGKSLRVTSPPSTYSGLAGLSSTGGAGSTQLLNVGAGVGGMSAVSGTISNGGTWGTSSVSTMGQQLQAYNAQLEAQYDAMKAQRDLVEAEKEKKHQTLFGKLFNYL